MDIVIRQLKNFACGRKPYRQYIQPAKRLMPESANSTQAIEKREP
jgi:hypothetical protein